MIDHDVLRNQSARDDLARKMAAWEAANGPIVTQPVTVRREAIMMGVPDGANFVQSPEKLAEARKRGGIAGSRHRQV